MRVDRGRRKHLDRLRAATHHCPPESADIPYSQPVTLRGWRLSDGREYPVTVTTISTDEETT